MYLLTLCTFMASVMATYLSESSYSYVSPDLCLDDLAIDDVVHNYVQLIGNYSDDLADSFLIDDFIDTSDSINALAGIPLGSVTFPTKTAFMEGVATQPKIPLDIISVNTVTCNTIVLRWTLTFGTDNLPVTGIAILDVVRVNDSWKLNSIHTEFNSLIFFRNLGGICQTQS